MAGSCPLLNQTPRHGGIWESGGIAAPFFTSALGVGEWSASRLGRFNPVKESPVSIGPLDRLGGPQNRFGHAGEDKNFCPCSDSNPGRPTPNPSLYRLSCSSTTNSYCSTLHARVYCSQ
jgi:hypothetical protein